MIRGSHCGIARRKMPGIIDAPLPRLERMIGEFRLRALSPDVERQEERREGGRK